MGPLDAVAAGERAAIASALLVLAFVLFVIGAMLPVAGPKGDFRIFTLPLPDQLTAIAGNRIVWRLANLFMGSALVVLVAGMVVLSGMLNAEGEQTFAGLGRVGLLLAAPLWVTFSIFRATVTVDAAQRTVSTGEVPADYEARSAWSTAVFKAYIVVGCLALAAIGVSLLLTGLVAPWAGWATVAFNLAVLAHLVISGDTLPGLHYIPPLLIAVLLLMKT